MEGERYRSSNCGFFRVEEDVVAARHMFMTGIAGNCGLSEVQVD